MLHKIWVRGRSCDRSSHSISAQSYIHVRFFCYGKMFSQAICNKKFVNSREYSVHFLVLHLLYGLNHPLRWSYSFSASVLAETKAKMDTEKSKKRSNSTHSYIRITLSSALLQKFNTLYEKLQHQLKQLCDLWKCFRSNITGWLRYYRQTNRQSSSIKARSPLAS